MPMPMLMPLTIDYDNRAINANANDGREVYQYCDVSIKLGWNAVALIAAADVGMAAGTVVEWHSKIPRRWYSVLLRRTP